MRSIAKCASERLAARRDDLLLLHVWNAGEDVQLNPDTPDQGVLAIPIHGL